MHHRIPAATVDAHPGRRDAAGTPDGHVLQDRPERPSTVRGARNYPCQEFPGKRAPTVQLCRDPKGYVPVGRNPWRGPPVPYDTPVTNGLNVLPPNKFPYIPPDADPDPGTPIVGPPPPGVVPGPGPLPNRQPAYDPPPPNDSGTAGRHRRGCRRESRRYPPQVPFPKGCPRRHRRRDLPGAPDRLREAVGPRRHLARNRRPAARPTPPTTKTPELSRTPQEALVSSRPAQWRSSAENWVDLMLDPRPDSDRCSDDTSSRQRSAFAGGHRARRAPQRRNRAPAATVAAGVAATVRPKRAPEAPGQDAGSVKPPPRRQPHRVLVGWISLAAALLAIGALAGGLACADLSSSAQAEAQQARDQRFVDTATQTVVNMFSYKQDNIDESVNRFVNGTSGPLRGMLSANNNVENLKAPVPPHQRDIGSGRQRRCSGKHRRGRTTTPRCWCRCGSRSPTSTGSTSHPCRIGCGSSCTRTSTGRMTGYDLKYPDGGN